jgi:hypothetical protein
LCSSKSIIDLRFNPINLMELNCTIFFDCLESLMRYPKELRDQFSLLLFNHILFVRLYRCTGSAFLLFAPYRRITSLPVYPSTIHGQCIVVLDTSN